MKLYHTKFFIEYTMSQTGITLTTLIVEDNDYQRSRLLQKQGASYIFGSKRREGPKPE
jgi:hypothetical protein